MLRLSLQFGLVGVLSSWLFANVDIAAGVAGLTVALVSLGGVAIFGMFTRGLKDSNDELRQEIADNDRRCNAKLADQNDKIAEQNTKIAELTGQLNALSSGFVQDIFKDIATQLPSVVAQATITGIDRLGEALSVEWDGTDRRGG